MPDTYFLIVGIVFTIIGMLCIFTPIKHKLSCSQKAVATIASVQRKKSGYWKGTTFYQYFPTFTYQVDGKNFTTKCEFPEKSSKKYPKGKKVEIWYNPKSPEDICVGVKISAYITGIILAVIGILFIICYNL